MGISLRKYTEHSAKNKRSYQLRTGQMKLPVRKIEPVQYVDSKENITDIPNEPIIGESYRYKGKEVICVEVENDNIYKCSKCAVPTMECSTILCRKKNRKDNASIILSKYNA